MADRFWHGALLYADDEDYVAGTLPFIHDALAHDAPVLVAVNREKTALLKRHLGWDTHWVDFVDMQALGQNPARIIPAWRKFVNDFGERGKRPLWGIGEPIWAERTPAELLECQRHEELLNVAFEAGQAWSLLCPYDTNALSDDVVEEARRSHPFVERGGAIVASDAYRGLDFAGAPFDADLPAPPAEAHTAIFTGRDLESLNAFVETHAIAAGLREDQTSDLCLAVNELASDSIAHAQGGGVVRIWREGDTVLAEVYDNGYVADPLVDRRQPPRDTRARRGMFVANELCDLVQLRSSAAGTTVRVHLHRRP
jgi:anti-sigma regulatory factor (Ser/Thr protein kinase)